MTPDIQGRIYSNDGNRLVLGRVAADAASVLDVGCGAGDNALRLRQERPNVVLTGITLSGEEAAQAAGIMDAVHVADLTTCDFGFLRDTYDVAIFSHVLEHLPQPAEVVRKIAAHVRPGGTIIIAVPNIAFWKHRLKIAMGKFEYEQSGAFDSTHLRFYTWNTAEKHLIDPVPGLRLIAKVGGGSFPLRFLRRLMPGAWSATIDRLAGRWRPNLFSDQVVLEAEVASAPDAAGAT